MQDSKHVTTTHAGGGARPEPVMEWTHDDTGKLRRSARVTCSPSFHQTFFPEGKHERNCDKELHQDTRMSITWADYPESSNLWVRKKSTRRESLGRPAWTCQRAPILANLKSVNRGARATQPP